MLPDFLETPKQTVLVEITHCIKRERFSKEFLNQSHEYTDNINDVRINCVTKRVQQLFKLKVQSPFVACITYEGVCNCKDSYIGKTK